MLVTGKFNRTFTILETSPADNGVIYKVMHVLENKNYLVKYIPVQMENDCIKDAKIY